MNTPMSTLENSKLHYCQEKDLSIQRKKVGRGFRYENNKGKRISHQKLLEYIHKLRIPPAWKDVRISKDKCSHILAIGFDEKGRKQYIYHPEWNKLQQENKFNRMVYFGEVLPDLREKISSDMYMKGLKRERVVATVVWLLENTFIRVGNQSYAKENKSYGLTTLREKHVDIHGNTVKFEFKGKSGVYHSIDIKNSRIARTIRKCIELPGYEIFQYLDEAGKRQMVDSKAVNEYLKSVTGEHFTAKDFRTWGGTVLAGVTLHSTGPFTSTTVAKKNMTTAVKQVARHLRNKPSTCRCYYIHPTILETYQQEILIPHFETIYATKKSTKLPIEEHATWTLIKEYAT